MATIVDSYSESNWDEGDWFFVYNVDDSIYLWCGQSFTGDGGTLNSAKFYLRKELTPTGNIVAKIYAHSGTFGTSSIPTGSSLAVSANVDTSVLPESVELVTFTFTGANKITLENGTKYVLTLETNGLVGTDGFSSVYVGANGFTSSHSGNSSDKPSSDPWNPYASVDIIFYVYKDDVVASGAPWEMLLTGVGR